MAIDITLAALTLTGLTAAASMFPGQRERAGLTRFALAQPPQLPDSDLRMDAATILERQREGGGAPRKRRWWRS